VSGLAAVLAGLGEERLAAVLARRPDARSLPVPTSLGQLADRLSTRRSVEAALADLPLPAVQLTEVLQVVGDGAGRGALARLIDPVVPAAEVDRLLAALAERALVWYDDDRAERLRLAGGLRGFWAEPLGLGRPVRRLLDALPPARLRELARTLRTAVGPAGSSPVAAVAGLLTDPAAVRPLVAGAPPAVAELLLEAAWSRPTVLLPPALAYGDPRGQGGPVAWALAHGLLLPTTWQQAELPREVGLALRGPDFRVPLDVHPPAPPPADQRGPADAGAGAMAHALAAVGELLDRLDATGVTALKSGGVGVREVRRLAKATGLAEEEVGWWLDLAGAAGLAGFAGDEVRPTAGCDGWRADPPAVRWAHLALTWWSLPYPPGRRRDPAGKSLPPMSGGATAGDAARAVRHDLLGRLAEADAPAAADPAALAAWAAWHRPFRYGRDGPELAAAALEGAATLGLVAGHRLTSAGAALAAGADFAGLVDLARAVLPEARDRVTFQADLTAVVGGPPTVALAELLGGAAELESRGGASVWRFSPASVRRALDGGARPDDLLAELRRVTDRDLPQPLTYLVRDVARVHGKVRVTTAGSVLVSADHALLAEIAAHRGLADLGLRILAPTVLASRKPRETTLARLRAAGYAPVAETASGEAVVERVERRRAPTRQYALREAAPARRPELADPTELARQLLAGADPAPAAGAQEEVRPETGGSPGAVGGGAPVTSAPADLVDRLSRWVGHLPRAQLELLAQAVDTGAAVRLGYEDVHGHQTSRLVEELVLVGSALSGWCHLREDERTFTLAGIRSVSPP